jgi:hypothetical protein
MNVFSVKSIGLYSIVIGSAIGFFHMVTSYGEANLKAPISVAGNYLINAQQLPTCIQNKQLLLKLQQSGIYLNASLVDERQKVTSVNDSRPTLSGRLNVRQFHLTGLLPTTICDRLSRFKIAGSLVNHLPGKILKPKPSGDTKIADNHQQQMQGQISIFDGSKTSSFEFTGAIQPSTQSH